MARFNNTALLYETIDYVLKLIDEVPKVVAKINDTYDRRIKFNLDLIAQNAIDSFYEDYYPLVYSRQEDLYKTYKIIITQDDRKIDFGPQYMNGGHRAGTEYIYNRMFVHGYHGGAPHAGGYYWRWPSPGRAYKMGMPPFYTWYPFSVEEVGAVMSPSPYELAKKQTDEYLAQQVIEEQAELDKKLNPKAKKLRKMVEKLVS